MARSRAEVLSSSGTLRAGPGSLSGVERFAPWGILLVALGFRLYAISGDMLFDPIVYAQSAYNLLQGTFTLHSDSWFPHRWPVFLPVAPCYALFGVGSLSSRLWPLALSVAQVALIYHLGLHLFGRRTALLAAFLAAIAPLDVVYAGVLNPDIVMAAFMTGAAVLWMSALEPAEPGRGDAAGPEGPEQSERPARSGTATPEAPRRSLAHRQALLLILSGICFALAVVTRENAVLLLVFVAGYVAWRRPPWSALLWAGLGVLAVALPLLLVYKAQTGDMLYRLGVVSGRYGTPAKIEPSRLLFYPSLLVHVVHSATGLFPWIFAAGFAGALLRPTRSRLLLLLWAAPILLYLEFGSMSLTRYLPILKRERFLTPLTAPLVLLGASVCLESLGRLQRALARLTHTAAGRTPQRAAAAALIAGLAVVTAASAVNVREQKARGERSYGAFRSVVQVIRREPALPVLFDHWRTGYRFSYYLGFREGADFYRGGDDRKRMGRPGSFGSSRLGYLSWYPDPAGIPDALIVLDEDALGRAKAGDAITRTYVAGEIPDYAFAPPASWRLVGTYGTFRVYRSGAAG